MENIYEDNINKNYKCLLCEYTTTKTNHWKRHLKSKKHLNKNNDEVITIQCDICNNTYLNKTTFLRHLKQGKCKITTSNNNLELKLMNEVIKQNQLFLKEHQQQTLDFVKELVKSSQTQNEQLIMNLASEKKTTITKSNRITNNNNNNNISINFTNNIVFQLKEKFPDALTMNEFLNTIQYSLGDLTQMPNKPAFIDQVTSIFCNKISQLETKERPLHFIQDNGLNSFYIKENGEWEQKTKDDMDRQLKRTAHYISKVRNDQWEEKLNSGTCTEKDQDNWTRYVKHVTTDITEQDIDRSLHKIKRSVQLNKKELLTN